MIDLHSHILSGLDDGAKNIEESIEMCWISYRDGVRRIVATPHTFNGEYQNDRSTILSKVHELNEVIKKLRMRNAECGVDDVQSEICNFKSGIFLHSELRTPSSELKILPGADVHFCEEILPQLDQGKVTTISDGGKFLIIEFPFHVFPYRAEEVLFQLMARGITPIISHPERNFEIGQRPQRYYQMIRMGCLGQVTAISLTGGFGPWIRRVAEKLLTHRLLHFIASDAHSMDERPPILSAAVRVAEKILDGEEAWKMVNEYPQAVIEGRRPDVPEPIAL